MSSRRANGEAALVVAILGQAATMWRSAARLLEREYPERYGRPGDGPAQRAATADPWQNRRRHSTER
jgi:hypothetical protein